MVLFKLAQIGKNPEMDNTEGKSQTLYGIIEFLLYTLRGESIEKSDLTGQTFGQWSVLERVKRPELSKGAKYLCQCSCGTTKVVWGKYLRTGKSVSCGCANKVDWVGQRHGKLTIIAYDRTDGINTYHCRCDCGNLVDVVGGSIYRTSSCGCSRKKDLTGAKFGKVVVLDMIYRPGEDTLCKCVCDCGNEFTTRAAGLVSGNTKSCGCVHSPSLIGKRFGKLTVIGEAEGRRKQRIWTCLCDCGNTTYLSSNILKSGHTSSCGCLRYDAHSRGETVIKEVLDNLGISYFREHTLKGLVSDKGWSLRFDFYIPDLMTAIEYDGEQHFKPVEYFGGIDKFKIQQNNDTIKNDFCVRNNIKLIRVPYSLSNEEIKSVIHNNLEMFENPVTTTVA